MFPIKPFGKTTDWNFLGMDLLVSIVQRWNPQILSWSCDWPYGPIDNKFKTVVYRWTARRDGCHVHLKMIGTQDVKTPLGKPSTMDSIFVVNQDIRNRAQYRDWLRKSLNLQGYDNRLSSIHSPSIPPQIDLWSYRMVYGISQNFCQRENVPLPESTCKLRETLRLSHLI